MSTDSVESFKAWTLAKVEGLECPNHGKKPSIQFDGASLSEIRISMRTCCEQFNERANRAIAGRTLLAT
jgi:hypothetical protein